MCFYVEKKPNKSATVQAFQIPECAWRCGLQEKQIASENKSTLGSAAQSICGGVCLFMSLSLLGIRCPVSW